MPAPADAAAPTRRDLHAVAEALDPEERAGAASRAASSACWSPTAPTPALVKALKAAVEAEGGDGRVRRAQGRRRRGERREPGSRRKQKIDGGPSVLYDAVAIVVSAEGAAMLGDAAAGAGLRQRRLRALQVHRLRAGGGAVARGGGRRRRSRRRAAWSSTPPPQAKAFVGMLGDLRYWPREKELWVN